LVCPQVEAPYIPPPPLEHALPEAQWRARLAAEAAQREEDARAAAQAAVAAAAAAEEEARAEAEAAAARAAYLAQVGVDWGLIPSCGYCWSDHRARR
jgi:hypothetical protein